MLFEFGNTLDEKTLCIDADQLMKERLLLQAISGSWKTQTWVTIAEQMKKNVQTNTTDKGLPIIFFNWEGERTGLENEIESIWIGNDGDVPIKMEGIYELATKVRQEQLSVIIDLSSLKSHEDREKYTGEFIRAILDQPQKYWFKLLIIIDEAQLLASQSDWSESREAIVSLMETGRKRGISTILVTQNLAEIHKNATRQCTNRLIGKTIELNDRKRSAELLGMPISENIEFAKLKGGEFYTFGNAIMLADKDKNITPLTTYVRFNVFHKDIPEIPSRLEDRITRPSYLIMDGYGSNKPTEFTPQFTSEQQMDKLLSINAQNDKVLKLIESKDREIMILKDTCRKLTREKDTTSHDKAIYSKGWNESMRYAIKFYGQLIEQIKHGTLKKKNVIVLVKENVKGLEIIRNAENQIEDINSNKKR